MNMWFLSVQFIEGGLEKSKDSDEDEESDNEEETCESNEEENQNEMKSLQLQQKVIRYFQVHHITETYAEWRRSWFCASSSRLHCMLGMM